MNAKNLFNTIKLRVPGSNIFDLSHDVKMSTRFGRLTPTLCMECVPGDRFRIGCESLIRFAPLVSPAMHQFYVTMHYFFVPNRILWQGWEDFITGNKILQNATPAFPFINFEGDTEEFDIKSLANYLGIPVGGATVNQQISALPFAAYQRVYDEYYRDQNVTQPISTGLLNGDNTANLGWLTAFRYRAWEHDYFTSALPWAQKGPAVEIPLGTFDNVPVLLDSNNAGAVDNIAVSPDPAVINIDAMPAAGMPDGTLYAATSELEPTSPTVNELRTAMKIQEWLEKNARAGTRYIENIFANWGVRSSDARLQRPEYITGTKSPVVISEVLNTTGETLPQGNMAGHGVSVTSGKYGSFYCEEHGYIIGIMSIMPKTAYQQGIPKHFQKFDRTEYFWPDFQHLGEQAIKQKEIYVDSATPEATFGYIPRYAEYRFMNSRVAGDFQDSLDFWHEGRIFDNDPTLSTQFMECKPSNRIFAVVDPEVDNLYCHVYHNIRAKRKMAKFGVPSF